MNIPFLSLRDGYEVYRDELDAAARRVLDSGWYILGKEVTDFEAAFAAWVGVAHGVGVGSGTDAIALGLRGLKIGRGDVVVTVSHTAVATVAAIEMVGATPVLVDIDLATFTIDTAKLDATLAGLGGKAKAVVAVHLYGHPCDLRALTDICRRHCVHLIEDCAQAHGAAFDGRRVGTYGELAAFSFYPTKNLGAFGDAGAITTVNPDLARQCAALRQYGWHERYVSDLQGVNSRLDELQAALLSVKLKYLDDEITARQRIAARYDAALADKVQTPHVGNAATHAYHLYVIRTPRRDALVEHLKTAGIGTAIHYPLPVHRQNAYEGRITLGEGGMEKTEAATGEILSLPLYPFLSEADQDRIIAAVRSF
jgi:dTDP-4-amino-4,6-dideoxygalactose transaminase